MMRRLSISLCAVAACGLALSAKGQYAAKVTMNSGSSFVVKQLRIEGDRIYTERGQSSSSVSMVQSIEFRFGGVGLNTCESMFRLGKHKALEGLLEQNIGPVAKYSDVPGNLGDYLVWWLRVQYWNRNQTGMAKTITHIRATGKAEYTDVASLYFVMLLLDQGKLENAQTVFSSVDDPEAVSVPMAEYIRGRIALERGELREAMQRAAQVLAFHARDVEWMAPATVLEAQIYQRMGQPQKAAIVAQELMMAYPDTQWSKLGETIKMESTGKRGG